MVVFGVKFYLSLSYFFTHILTLTSLLLLPSFSLSPLSTTDRQTDTQTQTQTDRQTDGHSTLQGTAQSVILRKIYS